MDTKQILIQIDRLRQIVESNGKAKPEPILTNPTPVAPKRDQRKAGKIARTAVMETIMTRAALLALASGGEIGQTLYFHSTPERFWCTGLARVIEKSNDSASVLASYSSKTKEYRHTFTKPISEWRMLWREMSTTMLNDHKAGKHLSFVGGKAITEFVKK